MTWFMIRTLIDVKGWREFLGMFFGPFRDRPCQYCDNTVSKWSAVRGVLNCGDCVYRMQMGQAPRCRKIVCDDPRHGHSH